MVHFILTILSIALTSAVLYVTVSYVNPTLAISREVSEQAEAGFLTLETAHNDYNTVNGGWLAPSANWASILTPQYAFMPRAAKNMEWRYAASGAGRYVCLAPIGDAARVAEAQYDGFVRFQNKISAQQMFVHTNACGTIVNSPKPATWPARVYVTYWIAPY